MALLGNISAIIAFITEESDKILLVKIYKDLASLLSGKPIRHWFKKYVIIVP